VQIVSQQKLTFDFSIYEYHHHHLLFSFVHTEKKTTNKQEETNIENMNQ